MRRLAFVATLSSLVITAAAPAAAQDIPPMLVAKDLLLPCQEADNDPRDGFMSQLECIGFIRGFVAAVELAGDPKLCIPEANQDDELRRSFVRWVHASYSKRSKMPVGEAVQAAITDGFQCQ